MKLPLISKLGAITGVFARLNPKGLLAKLPQIKLPLPKGLLAKLKGKKGDDDEHGGSVVIEDEDEDLFGDLGDLDDLDAQAKESEQEAAAAKAEAEAAAEAAAEAGDDDSEAAGEDMDIDAAPVAEEASSDIQALADLEAMPDFDEGNFAGGQDDDDDDDDDDDYDYDDDDDDDDDEEGADRGKIKKLAFIAGGGIAAAVLLGGAAWMYMGNGSNPAPDTASKPAANGEMVFNLDGLPPAPDRPVQPRSAAVAPQHKPPAFVQDGGGGEVAPAVSEPGTLTGGQSIASSGLGQELAALGLDQVQQPGAGIVVPSMKKASFKGLGAWPPGAALQAAPLASLVNVTELGPLPVVDKDGNTPFDAYARPEPQIDASKPRLALIITGLGTSRAATESAVSALPSDVSFALDIYARGLDFWMKKMRGAGHEVLLEMPSEGDQFPFFDPGPGALRTAITPEENLKKLAFILSRTSGYFGVLSTYGGKFLGDEEQITNIMKDLNHRGLMYVDGGAKGSKGPHAALKQDMPWAIVELNLDDVEGQAALQRQFRELESIALKRSMTVASISPTPLTLKLISAWLQSLEAKQIQLVPVSALAKKQILR